MAVLSKHGKDGEAKVVKTMEQSAQLYLARRESERVAKELEGRGSKSVPRGYPLDC